MKETTDKALWLILLTPGIVAIVIARMLSNLPGATDFLLTIMALFLSVVILGVAGIVTHAVYRCRHAAITVSGAVRSPIYLTTAALLSIVTGVGLAAGYENAWANRLVWSVPGMHGVLWKAGSAETIESLLRHATSATAVADFAVYDDRHDSVRNASDKKAVRLRFKSERIEPLVGRAKSWSFRGVYNQVYLTPACVEAEGRSRPLAGSGVWVNMAEVATIEFLDSHQVPCIEEQFFPTRASPGSGAESIR